MDVNNAIIIPQLKVLFIYLFLQTHLVLFVLHVTQCFLLSSPPSQHLDIQLKEVRTFIQTDSRVSANPIMRLVFGNPRLFLASLPPDSLIHCSAVWSCREKVSLMSLSHIVEQNDGKDTLPVLWRFLHRVRKW